MCFNVRWLCCKASASFFTNPSDLEKPRSQVRHGNDCHVPFDERAGRHAPIRPWTILPKRHIRRLAKEGIDFPVGDLVYPGQEIDDALGIDSGLEENATPNTIDSTFASLLSRMALQRRVVLLVDALDQLEPTTRGARERGRLLSICQVTVPRLEVLQRLQEIAVLGLSACWMKRHGED